MFNFLNAHDVYTALKTLFLIFAPMIEEWLKKQPNPVLDGLPASDKVKVESSFELLKQHLK